MQIIHLICFYKLAIITSRNSASAKTRRNDVIDSIRWLRGNPGKKIKELKEICLYLRDRLAVDGLWKRRDQLRVVGQQWRDPEMTWEPEFGSGYLRVRPRLWTGSSDWKGGCVELLDRISSV